MRPEKCSTRAEQVLLLLSTASFMGNLEDEETTAEWISRVNVCSLCAYAYERRIKRHAVEYVWTYPQKFFFSELLINIFIDFCTSE